MTMVILGMWIRCRFLDAEVNCSNFQLYQFVVSVDYYDHNLHIRDKRL